MIPSRFMKRFLCIALMGLLNVTSVSANAEEMERLASKVSEEIRDNLLAVQTKVAYVGMDGSRAYLIGDLAAIRPGQPVAFYRDGSAILSIDSPARVLGRESMEVGQGRISAVHDRTAWVQVDTASRPAIERGDWAVVQLDAPVLRVIPFFVDEGAGPPRQDGRGRILRSLILYNLKRLSLKVMEAPLLPSEVDGTGLPLPSALNQMDTDGVLLIGRLLPNPRAPDQMVVGVALFDLSMREMRFARSYDVKTLAAFMPFGAKEVPRVVIEPPATVPDKKMQGAPVKETREPAAALKGVFRMYLSTPFRMERPAKTPADILLTELVSASLPDIALEWIEDGPGKIRIVLPSKAQDIVTLFSVRSQEPAALSLIGTSHWSAPSDTELNLTLDAPVMDVRERLSDPEFRLLNDQFEPVGNNFAPYRIASKGARTAILEKVSQAVASGVWDKSPDTLILSIERDPRRRSRGFEEGQVDLHEILDEEFLKYGPASTPRVIQNSPEELVVLAFNLRRLPGSDMYFRRMVAMTVDRRTVLEVSLNQRGATAEGLLPPGAKDVAPVLVKLPEKNVLAAQVLARDRTDTGKLTIIFPVEEPHYGLIAEGIRADLATLNLSIEPAGLSWRAYADRLAAGDYDLAVVSLAPVSPYRLWIQQHFATTGKNNGWGYRNTIIDALVSESGDLGAAQDLIQSDLPVLPLFWLSRRVVLGPRVSESWPSVFPSKFMSSIRLK